MIYPRLLPAGIRGSGATPVSLFIKQRDLQSICDSTVNRSEDDFRWSARSSTGECHVSP